ncbi:Maf family protein [Adhaeretor mobilis]|uniref:Nucleoside triphosphate pyrophosphatase n=1 Tax=Adhaeretor mobilis TaxID=1930276 RepID=A0A517MX97_9BACT|nr:nucleoside triphosphate pyrophosphatase [Adhaeretor mobilis]QDS99508.1 Maf-like protein YhdE [Adhaeretor mobilis]
MSAVPLILASSSPQRQRLLREAGHDFQIVPPNEGAECGICSQCGPAELVTDLALRKAEDVSQQLASGDTKIPAGCLLIACDTVAECGGLILGKPASEDHAGEMLHRLSGTVHRVYSGLAVARCDASGELSEVDMQIAISELEMDTLADTQIDHYLASGLWEGKAGAIGYQDRVGWLHLIEGSESNVVGLPMELLARMIASKEK